MFHVIITLAQFIYILWPLFIVTTLVYSLQSSPGGRRSRRIKARMTALSERVRHNLLATWSFLFVAWLGTFLAASDTPSLIPEPWNTGVFLGGYGFVLLVQALRFGMFNKRVVARANLHRTRAIADLKAMDPYAFEGLVTETYRAYGYHVKHVGHSGDHGIDVQLYAPNGEHWIVQCKRYHDTVGESVIRDLYGSMVASQAQRAVLVTTAEITPPARAWAEGKPIDLVDGPALLELIQGARQRTEGNWFDRLAHALSHLLAPAPVPAVEETGPAAALSFPDAERLAPSAVKTYASAHANGRIHYDHGAPICPHCRLTMVARPARPTDRPGRVLYRCQNYPICRVVLEPKHML